ncbi:hypothetical protein V8E54_015027 [Elaphomyces granulatus]
MEPPQVKDFDRRLHSSTRTLVRSRRAIRLEFQISTTSQFITASSTSANAATNVTTDVSQPVILQIQDNSNDLAEEGGDDFVEIDDMLLDELDLEELAASLHDLENLHSTHSE